MQVRAVDDGDLVDAVRDLHRTSSVTASVCTGAFLLGAAGLLEGRTVTTQIDYVWTEDRPAGPSSPA